MHTSALANASTSQTRAPSTPRVTPSATRVRAGQTVGKAEPEEAKRSQKQEVPGPFGQKNQKWLEGAKNASTPGPIAPTPKAAAGPPGDVSEAKNFKLDHEQLNSLAKMGLKPGGEGLLLCHARTRGRLHGGRLHGCASLHLSVPNRPMQRAGKRPVAVSFSTEPA